MALPLSPNTSYVAGSPPGIKADDLNAIQQYLAGLYTGSYTIKTLYAAGVGGAVLVQQPGLVVADGKVTHTVLPNTANYLAGTVGQGTVARAWAVVNGDSSFARGFKVYSTGRTPMGSPAGDYTVVFDTTPSDRVNVGVFSNINVLVAQPTSIQVLPFDSGGRQAVRVWVFAGSTRTDLQFTVGIYAE